MPQVIVIGSVAKAYGPVKFNHASHVSNAGACAECHHQHGTSPNLACGECHAIDTSAFKKSVKLAKMRPCRECHSASYPAGDPGRPGLQVAYHRACFKCHRGDVGSVGKDPKGCVEMCHTPRAQAKLEKKP
jgi:predicted CXXCH cytochrome family protein